MLCIERNVPIRTLIHALTELNHPYLGSIKFFYELKKEHTADRVLLCAYLVA